MHIYFTMGVLPGISPKINVVFILILSFLKNEARIPDLNQKKTIPFEDYPFYSEPPITLQRG
jgi:hypothetical protein